MRVTDAVIQMSLLRKFWTSIQAKITKNVVDLIVKFASNALGINVYIYENSDGQILRIRSLGGLTCKDVFVKFTHNPIHTLGNHYNAILMKADFHNLDLLLNTAVSKIVQQPSANSKPNPSSQMEHPQPAHVHPPPPSAHHQLPPQFEQSASLPLDLFIKSTTTPQELTPTLMQNMIVMKKMY